MTRQVLLWAREVARRSHDKYSDSNKNGNLEGAWDTWNFWYRITDYVLSHLHISSNKFWL